MVSLLYYKLVVLQIFFSMFFKYKIITGVRRILDENNKTEALKEFSGVNIKSALSYLRKNFNDDQVYFGESDTDFDGSVSCFSITLYF